MPLMRCNTLILVEEECLQWLSECRLSSRSLWVGLEASSRQWVRRQNARRPSMLRRWRGMVSKRRRAERSCWLGSHVCDIDAMLCWTVVGTVTIMQKSQWTVNGIVWPQDARKKPRRTKMSTRFKFVLRAFLSHIWKFETCFTCMRIANFWFLSFPRWCSNTLKVWWVTCYWFCRKFTALCSSERILQIHQELTKL